MGMTILQWKQQFPDATRQGIIDVMWREAPALFDRLNFITVNGQAYSYTEHTRLPGVTFRALGEEFAATAEGVTNPKVETLAIMGGKITTDSILIAQKGLEPARAWRMAQKAKAMARRFIKEFIVGSKQTDAKSFDGLKRRLTGATQLLTNATNGALPNYKKVVELQDMVEGDNTQKLLLMNNTTRRNLSDDVAANAGGMGVFEVGSQLKSFNGSPIWEIFNDETETAILPFSETCGGSAVCSSIYCIRLGSDLDEEYIQGLSGLPEKIQATQVGFTGTQFEDVIQALFGIGMFSGFCAARLQGIKAS